jgi:HK97 family phage portal protein
MRLTDRISARLEQRTIGGVPWQPFVPFGQGGPVHPSRYHIGQDHALRLSPLYGAVKLLADGVASLPLKIYRNVDGKTVPWTGPSLFDKPAPQGTYYDWVHQCMQALLLHGNALGYVTSRDGFGFPQQIVWLPPEHCDIIDDETQDFANPVRPRFYYFGRQLDPADLLHVRAFTMAGHTAALSPLGAFKALIEGGLDQQSYSKMWFANGGFPPGTFKNAELEVDADQSRAIRAQLTETMRLRQPLVYGRDWDYSPISVKPEEAQFVETVRLTATEFASIYQVPPEMIGGSRGDSMTYANQEQAVNSLITFSLRPWLVRLETAFFDILPAGRYARFNCDAMIRTDTMTRYQTHQIARAAGWLTDNEIRDIEDRPPLPGSIGNETLPLDVLVSMSRGMGVMPKSFDAQVVDKPAPLPAPPPQPKPAVPGGPEPGQPGEPGKQPLTVTPAGQSAPPQEHAWRDGPHYSVEEITRAVFGLLAGKREYVEHVAEVARGGGYAVLASESESFSKSQAEWVAAEAMSRPRPVERVILNGKGTG